MKHVIRVQWIDEKGRRCTTFLQDDRITGEIVEITHRTEKEWQELANQFFPIEEKDIL
jgi:hypothetical protein